MGLDEAMLPLHIPWQILPPFFLPPGERDPIREEGKRLEERERESSSPFCPMGK